MKFLKTAQTMDSTTFSFPDATISMIYIYLVPDPKLTARPFPDPPETEWLSVNVNHIDPYGYLRYKCRNCEGVVEHRSNKQKKWLNFARLKHECQHCNRKYITKKQLRLHLLRHNEKTRVCQICDKRFLTPRELQNHVNTHTKAKPFGCPICYQSFAHTSRYYSHIRTYHKKYDCETCFYKICAFAKPCP